MNERERESAQREANGERERGMNDGRGGIKFFQISFFIFN